MRHIVPQNASRASSVLCHYNAPMKPPAKKTPGRPRIAAEDTDTLNIRMPVSEKAAIIETIGRGNVGKWARTVLARALKRAR